MSQMLVFLGDLKGTKSALESFGETGRNLLERRIANLHDSFATAFCRLAQRSRSLHAVTFSDSVVAYWPDISEGKRHAIEFMTLLWSGLDREIIRFRGFLDVGPAIDEFSVLPQALAVHRDRFLTSLPTGIAIWSVAVAEAAHFPDGLFVGRRLAEHMTQASFDTPVLKAGDFEYVQLKTCQQGGEP